MKKFLTHPSRAAELARLLLVFAFTLLLCWGAVEVFGQSTNGIRVSQMARTNKLAAGNLIMAVAIPGGTNTNANVAIRFEDMMSNLVVHGTLNATNLVLGGGDISNGILRDLVLRYDPNPTNAGRIRVELANGTRIVDIRSDLNGWPGVFLPDDGTAYTWPTPENQHLNTLINQAWAVQYLPFLAPNLFRGSNIFTLPNYFRTNTVFYEKLTALSNIILNPASNTMILSGTFSPEDSVAAGRGTIYLASGAGGAALYVKTNLSGINGWMPIDSFGSGAGSIVGATNLGLATAGAIPLAVGTNNNRIELRSLVPGANVLFTTNGSNIIIASTATNAGSLGYISNTILRDVVLRYDSNPTNADRIRVERAGGVRVADIRPDLLGWPGIFPPDDGATYNWPTPEANHLNSILNQGWAVQYLAFLASNPFKSSNVFALPNFFLTNTVFQRQVTALSNIMLFPGSNTFICAGPFSPEDSVDAGKGSLYLTAGAGGAALYVKTNLSGTSGWMPVTVSAGGGASLVDTNYLTIFGIERRTNTLTPANGIVFIPMDTNQVHIAYLYGNATLALTNERTRIGEYRQQVYLFSKTNLDVNLNTNWLVIGTNRNRFYMPSHSAADLAVVQLAGTNATNTVLTYAVSWPMMQRPVVVPTAPTNGQTFTAPADINFTGNATDADGTIQYVAVYEVISGTFFSRGADNVAGWTPYFMGVSNVAAGTRQYAVIATDNEFMDSLTNYVTVTINPGNQPPTVAITAPANNASFLNPATFTFSANASDPDGTVAFVEFRTNGVTHTTDSSSPYSTSVTLSAAGTYTLAAIAQDNLGLRATNTISITVTNPPNSPPTIAITAPANNSSFLAGDSFTVTATASDPDGTVSFVEFRQDGTLLFTDSSSPYSGSITATPSGAHTISAIAQDNLGDRATNSITVTYTNPPVGPVFVNAAARLDLPPSAEYNMIVNTRPGNGEVVDLNPPRFSWHYNPLGAYWIDRETNYFTFNLQVSTNTSFVPLLVNVTNKSSLYNYLAPFNNGTNAIYWRVYYLSNGAPYWVSRTNRFHIGPSATTWDRSILASESYLSNRAVHPRLIINNSNRLALSNYLYTSLDSFSGTWRGISRNAAENNWLNSPNWQTLTNGPSDLSVLAVTAPQVAQVGFEWSLTKQSFLTNYHPALVVSNLVRTFRNLNYDQTDPQAHTAAESMASLAYSFDYFYEIMSQPQRDYIVSVFADHCRWMEKAMWWSLWGGATNTGASDPDPARVYPAPWYVYYHKIPKIGGSHQIPALAQSYPMMLAAYDHHPDIRSALDLANNYMFGRGYPYGADGGVGHGRNYGHIQLLDRHGIKGHMVAGTVFPDVNWKQNSFITKQLRWWNWIFPVGYFQNNEQWGEGIYKLTGLGDRKWYQPQLGRFMSFFAGDGDAWSHALNEIARYESPGTQGPSNPGWQYFWDYGLEYAYPKPTRTTNAAIHAVFPEDGWAMAAEYPPSTPQAFTNGIGIITRAAPRGGTPDTGSEHQFMADGAMDLWAFGAPLTDGGVSDTQPPGQVSWTHPIPVFNGLGQFQDATRVTAPFYARLFAATNHSSFFFAGSDLLKAYAVTNIPSDTIYQNYLMKPLQYRTNHGSGPLAAMTSIRRHFTMVRGTTPFFIVYDTFTSASNVVQGFTWPMVATAVSNVTTNGWTYYVTNHHVGYPDVAVRMEQINRANPTGLRIYSTNEARKNPFTGEDYWYGGAWQPPSHLAWYTNVNASGSGHLMTVIVPWRTNETAPTITRVNDHTVTVSRGGDTNTVTFNGTAGASLTIDLAAIAPTYNGMSDGGVGGGPAAGAPPPPPPPPPFPSPRYFVATNGLQSNNGLTAATPWPYEGAFTNALIQPGDTVAFLPGILRNGIGWTNKISGNGTSNVFFLAYTNGLVVLDLTNSSPSLAALRNLGSNVTFVGINLTSSDTNPVNTARSLGLENLGGKLRWIDGNFWALNKAINPATGGGVELVGCNFWDNTYHLYGFSPNGQTVFTNCSLGPSAEISARTDAAGGGLTLAGSSVWLPGSYASNGLITGQMLLRGPSGGSLSNISVTDSMLYVPVTNGSGNLYADYFYTTTDTTNNTGLLLAGNDIVGNILWVSKWTTNIVVTNNTFHHNQFSTLTGPFRSGAVWDFNQYYNIPNWWYLSTNGLNSSWNFQAWRTNVFLHSGFSVDSNSTSVAAHPSYPRYKLAADPLGREEAVLHVLNLNGNGVGDARTNNLTLDTTAIFPSGRTVYVVPATAPWKVQATITSGPAVQIPLTNIQAHPPTRQAGTYKYNVSLIATNGSVGTFFLQTNLPPDFPVTVTLPPVYDWYVSTSGSESNPGTLASPKNVEWLLTNAQATAGQKIAVLPGTIRNGVGWTNLTSGTIKEVYTNGVFTWDCTNVNAVALWVMQDRGSNTTWRGFSFTSSATNAFSAGADFRPMGFRNTGSNNLIDKCIFYNCGNGIEQFAGVNLSVHNSVLFYNGWQQDGNGTAYNVYGRSDSPNNFLAFTNCSFGPSMGIGLHLYGSSGNIYNTYVHRSAIWASGDTATNNRGDNSVLVSSADLAKGAFGFRFIGNDFFTASNRTWNQLWLDYPASVWNHDTNSDCVVAGNYILNGSYGVLALNYFTNLIVTNNFIANQKHKIRMGPASNNVVVNWNTYVGNQIQGNGFEIYTNGGADDFTFSNWKAAWLGMGWNFDSNSTYTASMPTGTTNFVTHDVFGTKYSQVSIYNLGTNGLGHGRADNVNVNLSGRWNNGDTVRVRSAINPYYVHATVTITDNTAVPIPMTNIVAMPPIVQLDSYKHTVSAATTNGIYHRFILTDY